MQACFTQAVLAAPRPASTSRATASKAALSARKVRDGAREATITKSSAWLSLGDPVRRSQVRDPRPARGRKLAGSPDASQRWRSPASGRKPRNGLDDNLDSSRRIGDEGVGLGG